MSDFFGGGTGGTGGSGTGFVQSGIESLLAGAVDKDIVFPVAASSASYIPFVTPSWPTDWEWSARTVNGFHLMFTNEVPVGGGSVGWGYV